MLSITAVSDASYYLRAGSGCGGSKGSGGSAAEYELEAVAAGEPPGEWLYVHRNDLGVSGEIHAEGPSGDAFRTVVNHLRHPVTGEQLGRAPQHFASVEERLERFDRKHPDATPEQRNAEQVKAESKHRQANHVWDMTFSAPKSWSVLHAALERDGERHDEAEQVWAALRAGIEAALRYAADNLGFTRRGSAGTAVHDATTMRHVRDENFQAAIFRHHTSRERDPQLHAHVMVVNRVLSQDGQWRALFSPALLKNKHRLDAIFLRVAEAELTQRLGVRFATRPDGKAREVIGVSEEIRDLFSARTRAVDEKTQEKLDQWLATHDADKVPPLIKWRIQRRAVLETRDPKQKPKDAPSREEDISRWDAEIAKEFREGFSQVTYETDLAACQPAPSGDFDPDVVVQLALDDLTERKANWNRSHLMHAISQHLPDMLQIEPAEVPALLTELTEAALASRQVVSLAAPAPVAVPASLRDEKTGESVFEPPTGGRFTSRTHLAREDALVAWLDERGAPTLTEETAARVLAGRGLSDEQLGVATAILTSDRSLQIVNAAAGTGKSRLMAALSDTSAAIWGHGLTGFTVAENAAQVLEREGVARAHNIAAFLDFRDRERRGEVSEVERASFAVPEGATVVVDEASMVSTPQLTDLRRELTEAGVRRVVVIGDVAQVDAVDAGGGFRLLTEQREPYTLSTVRRFTNEWEREASTRLRDGDLEALTQYEARGRIRDGAPEDVEQRAVDAFVDDHLLGNETVLVVSSADYGAELSSHIRRRLVEAGRVEAMGVPLLRDTVAGVGDLVQTRMNNSKLGVVNREVWRVTATDPLGGELEVQRADHDEAGRRVWGPVKTLPADYVRHYVDLAYASTVEAVQGRTTDTGHLLVDGMMGRSRAYPGLTRGRERNTAWVAIEPPARRHRESDAEYEARIPSAMSAMVAAFEREDHTEAARSVIAAEQERATHLGRLGPEWQQLIAEHREVDHRQVLREVIGTDYPAVSGDLSVDGLLHLMRSAESHGYDVRSQLEEAYGTHREAGPVRLEGARSPASLLYALLDKQLHGENVRPSEQVTRAESYAERTPAGDGEEITYAREVAGVMDQRVQTLGERAEVDPPAWAQALLGPVPEDPFHRGEWREKVGVVAGYREQYGWQHTIDPVGPAPSRAEPEKRWAWARASQALGVDAQRDVVGASDGELANRVLAWRRAQEWAPRNVDTDLREVNEALGFARAQIVQARTRGEDPEEHVEALRELEARSGRLEQVASARREFVEHTAPVRDPAQEALVEMQRRVDRDRVVAERAEAKRAADDRDRREAADRDARIHAAVGERWQQQWVPDAPLLGSQRWAELDDEEPAKRASLFNAALQWWRMGDPVDERELNERLETHEVDQVPDRHLTHRGLERVRGGMDEEQARRLEPSREPEVLAEVHRFTGRDMEGDAPVFGSLEYADADDERKGRAETRAALGWHRGGDDLDERAHRAEVAEERAAAREIARDVKAEREARVDNRSHREVVEARGEQPPPERAPIQDEPPVKAEEPERKRPDTSWVRHAEQVRQREEPTAEREPDPKREESKVEREPQPTVEREPEPREKPEPAREAPKRDDLDEQVQRAKDAVEQMRQEDEARERVPEPRPEPVRERETPSR